MKNIKSMIELKVKVEEQLIRQFGQVKIEQYLYQMLQKLQRKEESLEVAELKTPLLDAIEVSEEASAYIEKHNLKANVEATLVRIADFFEDYTIKIKHTVDVEEGFETLFIFIVSELSVREAYKKTRAMYKDWALLKEKSFRKYVTITTRNSDAI